MPMELSLETAIYLLPIPLSPNKEQLSDNLDVEWVELRTKNGYKKFTSVLDRFKIPYTDYLQETLMKSWKKIE